MKTEPRRINERFASFEQPWVRPANHLHHFQGGVGAMRQLRWNIFVMGFLLLGTMATAVQAGPNAGGALWVHTDDTVVYTSDTDYAGLSGRDCPDEFECPKDTDDCRNLPVYPTSGRPQGDTVVWWVLAAFHPDACPRVAGVVFGVGWDEEMDIGIDAYGTTADFEISTPLWPYYFGEGTAVTWGSANRTELFEVYWFAGSAYYGPALFRITSHPTQGSSFADDSIPAQVDVIPDDKKGALGLSGETGFNPEPGPVPTLDASWGSLKQIFGTPE
jgi:hypothetical protein